MPVISARVAYAISLISGAVLWAATTAVSGRREAWDSSLYWVAAYPAGLAIAGALGYLSPEKAWRWGLALMLVQAVVLAIQASSFGLLPLGMILFGVLAVPPMGLASLAATLRRKAA